jgi:hypothetical protein
MTNLIGSIIVIALISFSASAQERRGVEFRTDETKKRVNVLVDGSLFTTYRWDADLKKPILYPINTARGTAITRGFPIDSRAGESIDHPHQMGLWLNYGDINGVDFWNNSTSRTADELKRMGAIVHSKIAGATGGVLRVEADWRMPDGSLILRETTTFVFSADSNSRTIERITELKALEKKVVFGDSKEGMFALRFRRELEKPTKDPILLTDANGKPSPEPILDNKNVSGEFRSSEGKIGDDVWGTRAKWATLTGRVGSEDISISIFDDPNNLGFPGYWMARGYGLFAINPLGRKAYENKEAVNFTLEPGKSITFRHRLVIASTKQSPSDTEKNYQEFIRTKR